MIDLDKIKVVCFDFDGTLCEWEEQGESNYHYIHREECLKAGLNYYYERRNESNELFFSRSPFMIRFMKKYCKGKKLYLTSACEKPYRQMKLTWVNKEYNAELIELCSDNLSSKKDVIEKMRLEQGLDRSEVLIVDDNICDVLWDIQGMGYKTMTPQGVAMFLLEKGDIAMTWG